MKSFRLTPAAESDLFEIWEFIAEDNVSAADRIEADFFHAFQRLAENPSLGHFRRDLTDKPLRFFAVRQRYLVVYDSELEPIQIIRVLHGSRDVSAQLRDKSC